MTSEHSIICALVIWQVAILVAVMTPCISIAKASGHTAFVSKQWQGLVNHKEVVHKVACICKKQRHSSLSIELFSVICNYQMQLGRSLWREERHSITCIISVAVEQMNTKHHIIFLLAFLSAS